MSKVFSKNARKMIVELIWSFTYLYIANRLERVKVDPSDRLKNELRALRRLRRYPSLKTPRLFKVTHLTIWFYYVDGVHLLARLRCVENRDEILRLGFRKGAVDAALHHNSEFFTDNNAENTILDHEGRFYSIDHESFARFASKGHLYRIIDVSTLLSSVITLAPHKYAAFVEGYFQGYTCSYNPPRLRFTTRLFSLRKVVFDVKNITNTLANMSSLGRLIPS